jgi:hypothetical protein
MRGILEESGIDMKKCAAKRDGDEVIRIEQIPGRKGSKPVPWPAAYEYLRASAMGMTG